MNDEVKIRLDTLYALMNTIYSNQNKPAPPQAETKSTKGSVPKIVAPVSECDDCVSLAYSEAWYELRKIIQDEMQDSVHRRFVLQVMDDIESEIPKEDEEK